MSDNVLIAIIAASGVVISAVMVMGSAVFAYVAGNRSLDKRFESMDKRLDKIEQTLGVIQSDMVKWYEQIFKIKAHVKLD
jgi:peptidoglycan hydrolase CwlO-like protein